MESIKSKHIVARKDHHCNFCGGTIVKGEKYNHQTNSLDGKLYTWKSHEHCLELIGELEMDTDDGVTDQAFSDYVNDSYEGEFPNSDNNDINTSEKAKYIYDEICKKAVNNG